MSTVTLHDRGHKAPMHFDGRRIADVTDHEIVLAVRTAQHRIDRAIENAGKPLPWPDWGHIKGDKR